METNLKSNAFNAMFYLMYTILKEQWKTLILLFVFIIVLIPLPKIFVNNGSYQTVPNGIIGLFITFPPLMITLIYLPMVHNQIYSSSIKKRLSASGVPSWIYATTIIFVFAAIALIAFYILWMVAILIWNNDFLMFDGQPNYIWFEHGINWLSTLLLTPMAIIGLSSTGLLIGRIKIPELIKGVLLFIFILLIIIMSRTIFNPVNSDMGIYYQVDGELALSPAVKTFSMVLILNPWGSMLYTMQHSFDSYLHSVTNVSVDGQELLISGSIGVFWNGILESLLISTIASITLPFVAILTIK